MDEFHLGRYHVGGVWQWAVWVSREVRQLGPVYYSPYYHAAARHAEIAAKIKPAIKGSS